MKNILLSFFSATLFCVMAYSQNLVVNPSFENTATNCSVNGGESFVPDLSTTWDAANSNSGGDSCTTPDLYSECNIYLTGPPVNLTIESPTLAPSSNIGIGFQYAHTGSRYAGIILRDGNNSEYREYLQGRLSSPLTSGQLYSVSMYVSRPEDTKYGTNNLGVYFSTTHYTRDACPGDDNSGIYVTPHLNYNQVITDTSANWFLLEWDYLATGGEQYFMIGNFFDNAGTIVDTILPSSTHGFAYYFIDDVSVKEVNCSASYTLTPDPNQEHNWFAVSQVTGIPPFNYQWSWGDGNTDAGAMASHTYDSAGYYNICLTVTDGTGCSNIYCDASTNIYKTEQTMVAVNCVLQLPTGIEKQTISKLNTYPNPATENLTIELNLNSPETPEIKLIDITGRVLWIFAKEEETTEIRCSIPVSLFAEGIYFVQAKAGVEQQHIIVIVKK